MKRRIEKFKVSMSVHALLQLLSSQEEFRCFCTEDDTLLDRFGVWARIEDEELLGNAVPSVRVMVAATITPSTDSEILFDAIERYCTKSALLMLQAGAALEQVRGSFKDGSRSTPLLVAVKKGNMEVTKALIDLGADMEAKDASHNTALLVAVKFEKVELVRLLGWRKGADIESSRLPT